MLILSQTLIALLALIDQSSAISTALMLRGLGEEERRERFALMPSSA
jgi:hypothetical protein